MTEKNKKIKIKYFTYFTKGYREYMEDFHKNYKSKKNKYYLFGIFDGHGGFKVAKICSNKLINMIITSDEFKTDINQAIINSFLKLDKNLMGFLRTGSTAVVVLIKSNNIYISNTGDSRAILFLNNKIIIETKDHKPNNKEEYKRIYKSGYNVISNRINGDLNVSRVFGDFRYKNNLKLNLFQQAVIVLPDIYTYKLSENDSGFIILASDGVFDVISSNDICKYIYYFLQCDNSLKFICQNISNYCKNKGSRDNITITIVKLGNNFYNENIKNKDNIINSFVREETSNYIKKRFINPRDILLNKNYNIKEIFDHILTFQKQYPDIPLEFKFYIVLYMIKRFLI